jgi:hypothetical protein
MPLSLSDDELAAIMDAAAPLPPHQRAAFLRAVSTELSKYPELGPGVIARVTAKLQRQHLNPPDLRGAGDAGIADRFPMHRKPRSQSQPG